VNNTPELLLFESTRHLVFVDDGELTDSSYLHDYELEEIVETLFPSESIPTPIKDYIIASTIQEDLL
jgi:hypothetical protein